MVKVIRDKTLFADFIIERGALGLSHEQIARDCEALLDLKVSPDSITEFVKENDILIKAREVELRSEIAENSPMILARLQDISMKLNKKLDILDKNDDMDVYAKIISPYLRSLELIGKGIGELRDEHVLITQSELGIDSFAGLELLESENLIIIPCKEKLMRLLE